MNFNYAWLVQQSKTDSQILALVNHMSLLDLMISRFAGIRRLRELLIDESDNPFFWLNVLETSWRVYMARSDHMIKASFSANFKRLYNCSTKGYHKT